MTYEQLKEKLKAQNAPASTHNPDACAYGNASQGDPWDDEDEAEWLGAYSQYHPAAKAAAEAQAKAEQGKEPAITEQEKEEMDHFWRSLIVLQECRGALEKILQLDTRKDFLSPSHHKDVTDLLSDVEDLVDQYDVANWDIGNG